MTGSGLGSGVVGDTPEPETPRSGEMRAVPYRRDLLASTLIYHQQTSTSGCHCGWGKRPEHLGRSYAEHVVNVYEMAVTEEATDA